MNNIEWVVLATLVWSSIGFVVALSVGKLLRVHSLALEQTARSPLHLKR